jgi:hypothetical protein
MGIFVCAQKEFRQKRIPFVPLFAQTRNRNMPLYERAENSYKNRRGVEQKQFKKDTR